MTDPRNEPSQPLNHLSSLQTSRLWFPELKRHSRSLRVDSWDSSFLIIDTKLRLYSYPWSLSPRGTWLLPSRSQVLCWGWPFPYLLTLAVPTSTHRPVLAWPLYCWSGWLRIGLSGIWGQCPGSDEELREAVALEDMAGPFHSSWQVSSMVQIKVAGSLPTPLSGMWISGFWVRSRGDKKKSAFRFIL